MLMNIILDVIVGDEFHAVSLPKQMCQSVDALVNIARAYANENNVNIGDVNIRFAYEELAAYPTMQELVDNYKEQN